MNPPFLPHTPHVNAGRQKAARAVDARRGELGLTQKQLGMDPSSYRAFVAGTSWPQARTRAKIEVALGWPVGEIARIALTAASVENEGDDPDMSALMRSDLPDDVKLRLIARLVAADLVGESQDEKRERQASHGG